VLPPDDEQVSKTNVNLKEFDAQEEAGSGLFQLVLTEPPAPWARCAEYELGVGFGMIFAEAFSDLAMRGRQEHQAAQRSDESFASRQGHRWGLAQCKEQFGRTRWGVRRQQGGLSPSA